MLHLLEQDAWIEHHTVANHAGRSAIKDPRWNEVEPELLPGVDDGVTGIVAALGANDHVGLFGKKIDHLALPLVAPLTAHEDRDHG